MKTLQAQQVVEAVRQLPSLPAVVIELLQSADKDDVNADELANKIALGHIESGIACGVDTTSDAPLAVNDVDLLGRRIYERERSVLPDGDVERVPDPGGLLGLNLFSGPVPPEPAHRGNKDFSVGHCPKDFRMKELRLTAAVERPLRLEEG
mgnify:CR=1 FL=1